MTGRTLAIGDVHGCHRALVALLRLIVVSASDTLVFIGDVVDRGPSTKQVVDRLLALRDSCKVVLIMGNHEEMMRDAISGRGLFNAWLDVGGRATLDSYGGSTDAIPPEHIRLLLSAHPFWETDTEIFVHACLESEVSLRNQTSDFLRWKHLGGSERPHLSGKRVICGHTPQTDGVPLAFDGWVCIDTFPHGGKWLTCLDVESNQVYQASEDGNTREFPLSQYSQPHWQCPKGKTRACPCSALTGSVRCATAWNKQCSGRLHGQLPPAGRGLPSRDLGEIYWPWHGQRFRGVANSWARIRGRLSGRIQRDRRTPIRETGHDASASASC